LKYSTFLKSPLIEKSKVSFFIIKSELFLKFSNVVGRGCGLQPHTSQQTSLLARGIGCKPLPFACCYLLSLLSVSDYSQRYKDNNGHGSSSQPSNCNCELITEPITAPAHNVILLASEAKIAE